MFLPWKNRAAKTAQQKLVPWHVTRHVNTDLDSIAGAIAAADLYDGVAARAEEDFNGEIAHALSLPEVQGKVSIPPTFDAIPGGAKPDPATKGYRKVCLVDHNEVIRECHRWHENDVSWYRQRVAVSAPVTLFGAFSHHHQNGLVTSPMTPRFFF